MTSFIYGGIELKYDFTTVLKGIGEFQEWDGEVYEIESILLPTDPSGKHISVKSKTMDGCSEWRGYDDGKILNFESKEVEHW